MNTSTIREPFFAGSFYSESVSELRPQIEAFFSRVSDVAADMPRIMIVPHAGYNYSGGTAAHAFKTLEGKDVDRIILIGASHKHHFDHIALDDRLAYRTPLGDVPVDLSFVRELALSDERIKANHKVHDEEHSLEVELPFLQSVISDFSIVPILLSADDGSLGSLLADKLSSMMDDKTVVIISSDFSHYPPADIAEQVDKELVKHIVNLDVEAFDNEVTKLVNQAPGLVTRACGAKAIRSSMLLAKKLGFTDAKLLNYTHSGDTPQGEAGRVVGYAAITFSEEQEEFADFSLNEEEKREALTIARQTLESYLEDETIPDITIGSKKLLEPYGAFVTLNTEGGHLRGCIGQFDADAPLGKVIQDRAILAAVGDTRFTPVTREELDSLHIEISVLSPMRKISSPDEIEMGKHGVYIKKGDKRGTYLPQVAEQFNYDKEAFMNSLTEQKAGMERGAWKDGSAELFVYTAYVFEE